MFERLVAEFEKLAADVKLQPHQVRLQHRLRNAPGVLAYWGLGSGKCVRGDTVIVTDAGVLPISDFFPAHPDDQIEQLLAPPSALRVWSGDCWRPVRSLYSQRISEGLVSLATVRGNSVVVTQAHPMLCLRDGRPTWVPAAEIVAGDWLAVNDAWGAADGSCLDPILELLLWQITEGNEVAGTNRAVITQKNKGVLERLQAAYRARFSSSGHIRGPHRDGVHRLEIESKAYRTHIEREYGFSWGKKSAEKRLPAAVFSLDLESTARALSVLFEAEGHVEPTTVELTTASVVMAHQIQALLRRLGIVAAIRRKMAYASNTEKKTKRPYYRLSITGDSRRRFAASVPSIGKSWAAPTVATPNPNHGIPWDWVYRRLADFGLLGRVKKLGVPLNSGRSLSRPSAERLVGFLLAPSIRGKARGGISEKLEKRTKTAIEEHAGELVDMGRRLAALLAEGHHFQEVKTAELTPFSGVVYDLEVDSDVYDEKRYTTASGLVLHNTIGSIAGADSAGRDAVAVVPAALRNNYRKEIAKVGPKQHFDVTSYEGFDPESTDGKTLILDEGQRIKNPGSTRSQAVFAGSQRAHKRIVLSGTPIPNQPEDLGPLMNIVAGKHILPTGPDFRKKFLREQEVSPGLWGRLRGVKPGVEYSIANKSELANRIRGLVDYHPSAAEGFPSVIHQHHDIEMDPRQKRVYEQVLKNVPPGFFHKMERGLPPSKAEARQLNAFLTASRIVSNTPAPYQKDMTPAEGFQRSPKLQTLVSDVVGAVKRNPHHRAVIYSNFLEGGVQPVSDALARHGITHHVFTGGISDKHRAKMVADYNEGRAPVLLISGAGAEGLDLKGTRSIHITEPHWNDARIKQVIGRGVRYKSHEHLPPSERNVTVHTYHSIVPRGFLQRVLHKGLGTNARSTSTDQYLKTLATQKQKLTDQFNAVLQEEGSKPVKVASAETKDLVDRGLVSQAALRTIERMFGVRYDADLGDFKCLTIAERLARREAEKVATKFNNPGYRGASIARATPKEMASARLRQHRLASQLSFGDKRRALRILRENPKAVGTIVANPAQDRSIALVHADWRGPNIPREFRRLVIAHEAFHAKTPILGKSEILAHLYGGWKAGKGTERVWARNFENSDGSQAMGTGALNQLGHLISTRPKRFAREIGLVALPALAGYTAYRIMRRRKEEADARKGEA